MNRNDVKRIAKFIVGFSTAWTVGNVIGNNTTTTNRRQKAQAVIGGAAIGAMVADQAENMIDREIDRYADVFTGNKNEAPKE